MENVEKNCVTNLPINNTFNLEFDFIALEFI